jgi:lysophospholipase L1-like esterase
MARDVSRIKPKLATIYFGWNDHWCTFGIEDKAIGAFNLEHSRALTWLSEHSGVVQLFNKVVFQSRFDGLPEQLRVSLEDFRANLQRMVDLARENGITPVLLTAPSAHEEGDEPVYVQMRWLRRKEDLVPLHRSYAAVVREVAAERGVLLVDLLARFDELPREERRASFVKDGVHLTEKGDALIARFLFDALAEAGLLELVLH